MSTVASAVVVCPSCGQKNRVPHASSGRARCGSCQAPLPWIAVADDTTYPQVVDGASIPVLLDLWAPWCGPCRAVSPALERIAESHAGRIKLVKVNVDESPSTAQRFDVRGIPTLLVLDKGEVVARQTGAAGEQHLRSWLEGALGSGTT
jgi:thioredoxin 2